MTDTKAGMKASTIKIVLNKKLNNWLDSILDEGVRKVARENVIVTGGAIASMLQGDAPNDYDIYFKTQESTKIIAEYYVGQFNAGNPISSAPGVKTYQPTVQIRKMMNCKGVEEERVLVYMKSAGVAAEDQEEYKYFESRPEIESDEFIDSLVKDPLEVAAEYQEKMHPKRVAYRPVFFSENAITLSDKIQIVIRFYGSPDQIHENYDYSHCMCWYDMHTNHLELKKEAVEAILSKSLVYRGSLYPLASIFRLRKFISRGWRITAGQLLKICWQISELDLKNPTVLREQLIGVDQAYMTQLLSALKENNGKVDATYLAKLVDEIFE